MRWYPRDTRWNGPQKHYFNVSTFKSLILFAYVILIIVEAVLLRRWINDDGEFNSSDSPWAFWTRTGIYIIIDAILSLTMAFFIWKEKWHPIAALVTSILASALWLAACFLNAFIAYSNEYWFLNMDAWRKIVYGEAGLQAVLVLCYWAMMGFAAKAVHEWRKVKNGRGNRASVRKADEVSLDDRGNIGATQSETSRTMAGSAV